MEAFDNELHEHLNGERPENEAEFDKELHEDRGNDALQRLISRLIRNEFDAINRVTSGQFFVLRKEKQKELIALAHYVSLSDLAKEMEADL